MSIDPDWPLWEIWMEGFATADDQGTAHLVGRIQALTFSDACTTLFENYDSYDGENLSVWGYHLFPTEQEARQSFG